MSKLLINCLHSNTTFENAFIVLDFVFKTIKSNFEISAIQI